MRTIPQRADRTLPRRARRGFSLVEVISALSVVGILAGLGAARLQPAVESTRAAQIAADLRLIGLTLEEYSLLHDTWPRTAPEGEAPAELAGFLPAGLRFRTADYVLQYVRVEGSSRPRGMITVRALRPDLARHLDAALGARPGFGRAGSLLAYGVGGGLWVGGPESGNIAAPER